MEEVIQRFKIIEIKLELLYLAKELVEKGLTQDNVIEIYLDLREEILEIPKLIKQE